MVLYTASQEIDSDCIPFTHNLLESDIIRGSKRKGKEKRVANAAGLIDQNCKLRVGKTSQLVAIGRGRRRCLMMLSP